MSETQSTKTKDEKPCPRCGDLFYNPKTMIEDARQHAKEWEERANYFESRLAKAREALEYVARHGNEGHMSVNILDECATVARAAIQSIWPDTEGESSE